MPTPLPHWLYFHAAIALLMGAEYLLHLAVPDTRRKAIYATLLWTAAALALAAVLLPSYGSTGSIQYLAGYAIEQALSIDNLFVFLLLFKLFRIPEKKQPKVLFWGVAGAILMRGAFIFAGVGLLTRFHWISYVFAAILLFAAIKMLLPESKSKDAKDPSHTPSWIRWLTRLSPVSENQDHFFVKEIPAPTPNNGGRRGLQAPVSPSADPGFSPGAISGGTEPESSSLKPRRMMTILFLALIAVELTDVVFALDSIPAVLSITRVPFLAYTSNIMAVMGLRSLYVLLAAMLSRFRYIHLGLSAVLIFAALKMFAADWIEIGPLASLAVIATLLGATIAASLLKQKPA